MIMINMFILQVFIYIIFNIIMIRHYYYLMNNKNIYQIIILNQIININ